MKRVHLYIPNVILTLLLVFLLIGCEGTILARRMGLSTNTFRYVTIHQKLADKGYENLTTYFRTRSNSTGIPAEVILDNVTKEAMQTAIIANADRALAYLCGSQDTYATTMDFTALENAMTDFFVDYAKENGYAQDDAFEEKLQSSIDEAEAKILETADPFQFGTLQSNGWLAKLRKAVSYLNFAMTGCLIAGAVLLVLLVLCNLRQPEHLCYWLGLAALVAGILMAIPCIYLTASDLISGFAIKDQQIYAGVVGFLSLLISRGLTMAIITAMVGIIGVAGFAFLRAVQREDDEA